MVARAGASVIEATMERRRAPRVRARLEVAYEDPERQVFLIAANLSEGGAFLLAPDPPPPGVTARLVFELPGYPAIVRLPAVVARCQEGPRRGFAVRFDSPSASPTDLQAVRHYVERVSKSSPDSIE